MYSVKIQTGGLNFFKNTIFMFRNYYNIMQLNQNKRIRAGAVLPAVRVCGSQPSFFPDGVGVFSDPVSKTGYF